MFKNDKKAASECAYIEVLFKQAALREQKNSDQREQLILASLSSDSKTESSS